MTHIVYWLVLVLLCLSQTLAADAQYLKVYHGMEGARGTFNFEIFNNFTSIKTFCLSTASGDLTGIRVVFADDKQVSQGVQGTESCIQFTGQSLVRYYELIPAVRGSEIRLYGISLATATSSVSFNSATNGNVQYVPIVRDGKIQGLSKTSFFFYQGAHLVGFYGFTNAANNVYSLGFIFAKTTDQTKPPKEYATSVGEQFKTPNLLFDRDEPIEEICCGMSTEAVGFISVKTKNHKQHYGNFPTNLSCLKIGGKPITWQASRYQFESTNRLGHLKISDGTNYMECKTTYTGRLTDTYSSGNARVLIGIHGYFGVEIDTLGPIFRQNIKDRKLIAYKYLNEVVEKQPPKAVVEQNLINDSTEKQNMKVSGTYTAIVTNTVSTNEESSTVQSTSYANTLSVGIFGQIGDDAGTYGKLSVDMEFTWSSSSDKTMAEAFAKSSEATTEETFTYEVPLDVPPKTVLTCSIIYLEQMSSQDYEGVVQNTYEDGTYDFSTISGTLKKSKHRSLSVRVA